MMAIVGRDDNDDDPWSHRERRDETYTTDRAVCEGETPTVRWKTRRAVDARVFPEGGAAGAREARERLGLK